MARALRVLAASFPEDRWVWFEGQFLVPSDSVKELEEFLNTDSCRELQEADMGRKVERELEGWIEKASPIDFGSGSS